METNLVGLLPYQTPGTVLILIVFGIIIIFLIVNREQIRFWALGHKILACLFCTIAVLPFVFYSIWQADSRCLVQIFSKSRGSPCWSNPGSVFVVLAGIATLLGLLLTILTIISQSTTVMNYEILMNKLINFVKESNVKKLKFSALLQTPLVGNISHPEKSKRLGDLLTEALSLEDSQNKIICLRPEALDNFYDSLTNTISTNNARRIKKRIKEARDWLSNPQIKKENVRYYDNVPSPTYHIIFTEQKGYLFIPFFRGTKIRGIEVFCLELNDPAIIDSYLQKTFDYYWKISKPANS